MEFTPDSTITYDEVKQEFLNGFNGRPSVRSAEVSRCFSVGPADTRFYGATSKQVAGWVLSGYDCEEFDLIANYTPPADSRRLNWNEEEGDLNITAALNGDDEPFQMWEPHHSKPGIKVVAEFGGRASMPASVLAEYGAFLGGIIDGFYRQGFDPELSLRHRATQMTAGSEPFEYEMILKEAGEKVDFREFAAMFSPGGVRILGFIAKALAVTKAGKHFKGVGSTTFNGWSVEWNEEKRTLYIGMSGQAMEFPADHMIEQVKSCGLFN
jgi:hypothetical protein